MKALSLAALLLAAAPAAAQSADPATPRSMSVQVHGQLLLAPGGYITGPGIELGAGAWGLEVGANYLGYEYWEGTYYESGEGYLVNGRGRYYPQANADCDRLWVGGGFALGVVDTYWRDNYDNSEGYETNPGIVVNFGAGYKILLANGKFVIDPQVMAGVIVGAEQPFIAGAGLNIGVRF